MGFDFSVKSDALTKQLAAVTAENSERRIQIDDSTAKKHAAELQKQQMQNSLQQLDRVEKEVKETGDKLIDTTDEELKEQTELLKLQHTMEERLKAINAQTKSIKSNLKKITDKRTAEAELVLQATMYHDVDDYKEHLTLIGGCVKDKDLDK